MSKLIPGSKGKSGTGSNTGLKILIIFSLVSVAVVFVVLLLYVFVLMGDGFSDVSIGDKVAVIPVKGVIDSNMESRLEPLFESVRDDKSIKAVVLDIDSGGGGVIASKSLMREVENCDKPVVAYIGNIGASGAYYVASAADEIYADEDSLTGSIGVIMVLEHYYGLFEKVGINVSVIKSGDRKDIGSPYRDLESDERQRLQQIIDQVHEHFVINVANNRGMKFEDVKRLAQGDLYLGVEAKKNGLIDETGTLDDAISKAADLAGIEGDPVVKYMKPEVTFADLFAESFTHIGYGMAKWMHEHSSSGMVDEKIVA